MIAALLLAVASAAPATTAVESYGKSVVSIEVSYQEWDDQRPWTKKDPGLRTGNAVVVAGPLLLTNAQMIAPLRLRGSSSGSSKCRSSAVLPKWRLESSSSTSSATSRSSKS